MSNKHLSRLNVVHIQHILFSEKHSIMLIVSVYCVRVCVGMFRCVNVCVSVGTCVCLCADIICVCVSGCVLVCWCVGVSNILVYWCMRIYACMCVSLLYFTAPYPTHTRKNNDPTLSNRINYMYLQIHSAGDSGKRALASLSRFPLDQFAFALIGKRS